MDVKKGERRGEKDQSWHKGKRHFFSFFVSPFLSLLILTTFVKRAKNAERRNDDGGDDEHEQKKKKGKKRVIYI